jgi:hypothetical protein
MRRPTLHAIVAIIAGVFLVGAALLAVLCIFPAAVMLAVWALILVVGLAIERWRYKRLGPAPSGPDWQRTDERFVDPETGKLVTVYFHPATGERRYVAA